MIKKLDWHRLYKTALRIRIVESTIAAKYPEGKMRCPVHLSIGQEIPSAIFEQIVEPYDTAISTHRAHAHYLAKGGDLPRMIAEIYGKVTGCSKGRGGSMHLIDLDKGFLGSSAIVGNSIPIGVGVAYGNQLTGSKSISFIFLGDAAAEEGVFYESANFAAVHKLPTVFVLENNFYSVYTNLASRQPAGRSLAQLARAIGLRSASVEDSNFSEAYIAFKELTEFTRLGYGPTFIEINTYRKLEHCGPNDDDILGYRPSHELVNRKEVDLVNILENLLNLSSVEKTQILTEIKNEVLDAFNYAEKSPFPTYAESIQEVYAN